MYCLNHESRTHATEPLFQSHSYPMPSYELCFCSPLCFSRKMKPLLYVPTKTIISWRSFNISTPFQLVLEENQQQRRVCMPVLMQMPVETANEVLTQNLSFACLLFSTNDMKPKRVTTYKQHIGVNFKRQLIDSEQTWRSTCIQHWQCHNTTVLHVWEAAAIGIKQRKRRKLTH